VIGYGHRVGPGRANLSLAYNYNQTKVRSGTSAAIPNETQRRIFEERLPKHNGTATLGYDIGPVALLARARYYGAWTDVTGNATGELFQRFGSIALFDVSAAYKFDDHFTLRVGAENVANTYPAEATNQAVRGLIYSRNAPYDTDGGQYYVRVGMSF
jgi:iron complex outermembrane receptor protein